jgi:hypothetical protein
MVRKDAHVGELEACRHREASLDPLLSHSGISASTSFASRISDSCHPR